MLLHHRTLSSPLLTNLEPNEKEGYRLVSNDLKRENKICLIFFAAQNSRYVLFQLI